MAKLKVVWSKDAQDKYREIARNFKALGVSIDTIMKATGLTIEEIEKL